MKQVVPFLLLAALTTPAIAQKDRIVWTDGKVSDNLRIEEFTWRQVRFRERGGRSESRSADAVASLEVARVREIYKRAFGAGSRDEAFDNFLREARKQVGKDKFIAQFGYIEGARLLIRNGQYQDAFALLEEMVEKLPDTGFYPELFRIKLDYYLAMGEAKVRDAKTVATRYSQEALRNGWPDGFVQEAAFYELMARRVAKEIDDQTLLRELEDLRGKTAGVYPGVAARVMLQIGHALRRTEQPIKARKVYEEVLKNKGIDDRIRGEALLGLGHTYFAEGDPTNTEPYRTALLTFLRVYLETENASPETRAEALHFAAIASDKWRGPDSGQMARRLRGFLRRDFPESRWARR